MHAKNLKQRESLTGFTLIELLVTIGILAVLGLIALPVSHYFEEDVALNNSSQQITETLRLAQNKTLASENAASWGVFFNSSTNQYTFFKGANFSQRDTASDEVFILPKSVEFSSVTFPAGEVVFAKITGFSSSPGNVSLRVKQRPSKTQSVFLGSSGEINMSASSAPSDLERVKDSRHVHIAYAGRTINAGTETLNITFPNGGNPVVQNIPLAWEGSVNVEGRLEQIKIHTHFLNDPVQGTLFSIHRDKMLNTKGFYLELSGDSTGNLIGYNDSGQTTQGTSIYVSSPNWQ